MQWKQANNPRTAASRFIRFAGGHKVSSWPAAVLGFPTEKASHESSLIIGIIVSPASGKADETPDILDPHPDR